MPASNVKIRELTHKTNKFTRHALKRVLIKDKNC